MKQLKTAALATGVAVTLLAGQGAAAVPGAQAAVTAPRVTGLRTDNLVNPIGIDDGAPLLSWRVAGSPGQVAYQLRAAHSTAALTGGRTLVDTGKVRSASTNDIAVDQLDLHSRETIVWQVRVWDGRGKVSRWSTPARWEMGLLGNAAWDARWIENPSYDYTRPDGSEMPLPVFGKSFTVGKNVARARLYMTGLGMYDASVNGRPVGKAVLEPGQTTYDDEVDYRTYDLTSKVRSGRNVVGIETGSGPYQRVKTPGHYFFGGGLEKYTVYGEPKVIAQLEITYKDGRRQTISSDPSWRTTLGPTTYSSWWSGEEYDARQSGHAPTAPAHLTGSGWRSSSVVHLSATTTPRADTPLVANPRPPVTVAQKVRPRTITKVGDGYVLDFGANRSGWPQVSLAARKGQRISMIPAEELKPDGTLDTRSTGVSDPANPIAYRYTSAGRRHETWHPRFTYSGFRYLRVDGLKRRPSRSAITMLVVHAANPRASAFSSSNSLLNQIHAMTVRSIQSNMMSVLTDCPDREKGPYTGDNLHDIDALLTDFDLSAYEPQLVRNMATAQRKAGDEFPGLIANIAPEFHRVAPVKLNYPQGVIEFLDEVNWGSAIIRIPWKLYTSYGDTRTMARSYDNMVKWLDYEAANRAENEGDIPGLGDWSATDNTTPMQLAIYAGYYTAATDMTKIAGVLGKDADQTKYRALATDLASTFTSRFRHTDATGVYYGSDSEASNAMALDAGLVAAADRPAVLKRLVASVRRSNNHVTTGSVALGPLFRALQAGGRDDVIYDMVTNRTAPGYGYLVERGNTTLAESLDGSGSQSHHFLGQVDDWFVSGVAGIRQASGSVGYRHLEIKPAVVGNLSHASGSYRTPYGTVTSSWHKDAAGTVTLRVSIPSGTDATVTLPGGGSLQGSSGAHRSAKALGSKLSSKVGAGTHVFTMHR